MGRYHKDHPSNPCPCTDPPKIPPWECCPHTPGALPASGMCPFPEEFSAQHRLDIELFPDTHPKHARTKLQPFPQPCPCHQSRDQRSEIRASQPPSSCLFPAWTQPQQSWQRFSRGLSIAPERRALNKGWFVSHSNPQELLSFPVWLRVDRWKRGWSRACLPSSFHPHFLAVPGAAGHRGDLPEGAALALSPESPRS